MNNTSNISKKEPATDLVNLKFFSNNVELNGNYRVLSVEVMKSFNKISAAKVTIADGDPSLQDFAISSKDDTLLPGNDFEIRMGYHSDVKPIFKGVIIKHAIKSAKNKPSILNIEARDKVVKMSIVRKSHCFINKSDSDIIQDITKKAGFKNTDIDMADTKPAYAEMVQFNVTDWDFIVCRAEMNSMVVITENNKLIIKQPEIKSDQAKEISFGTDVIEFESESDARTQLTEIKSHTWNIHDQKVVDSATATSKYKENGTPGGSSLADSMGVKQYDLFHSGWLTKDELQSWSNAQLLKSRMAKSRGKIKIKGTADFSLGQTLKLKGFSKRFNGDVCISGIGHSYNKSIWETEISFGLPEKWFYQRDDILDKPASGLVPGVNGLQIGVVVQLENDPGKEDRVKIHLPLVDQQEGIWARVATLDAGNERGSFFRPEIHDEVIIGFINDDPRHAVILGMLNSSAKPAPVKAKDSNPEKGFFTKNKLKFVFNDEDKSILLETRKGKKIRIDEKKDEMVLEDEHKNKIVLGAQGITIESGKDISFKATSGNIKLDGNNIEHEAKIKFSANGNSTAEFKSTGPTIVKGAVVNIN